MSSTFQDKITALADKLYQLDPNPRALAPDLPQLLATSTSLQQQLESTIKQHQQRYQCLMLRLQLHLEALKQMEIGIEDSVDKMREGLEMQMEGIRGQTEGVQEDGDREHRKLVAVVEEQLLHERGQFDLGVRDLVKELQGQSRAFERVLATMGDNPMRGAEGESKVYRDYLSKLGKIEQNERKKAERITEIERKTKARLSGMYETFSAKIAQREKTLNSKYQKMKRLFSLIVDIS